MTPRENPQVDEVEESEDDLIIDDEDQETGGSDDETIVSFKPNLESKAYQDSLRREQRTDPLLFCRMVKENPELRDWIVSNFGEDVLADEDQVELESSEDEGDENGDGLIEPEDHSSDEEAEAPEKKVKVRKVQLGIFKARKSVLLQKVNKAVAKAARKAKAGDALARADLVTNRAPLRCVHNVQQGSPDKTRLNDTSLATDNGRIHTLTAVTQGLLNNRLKYLWAVEEEMQSMNIVLESGEEIVSYLLPPKIHLEVEIDRPGGAVYYIYFDYGGHAKILDNQQPDGFRILSIEGWRFAFDIDIALEDVEEGTEEAEAIRKKLGKEGDFRISRLLTDFTTADIMRPRLDLCQFAEEELDDETLERLKILLDSWRNQAVESGLGIMGWSATTDKPESVQGLPPAFTPTGQQIQTYPYLPPGQEKPVVGLDDPIANYNQLLYLNMTDNTPFPRDRFLDYSGNWCTPYAPVQAPKIPEIHATMCIGRDIFFSNFIIPHLTYLNKASWIEAKKPSIQFKNLGVKVGWKKSFGGQNHAFYNSWKPVEGKGWSGWEWVRASQGRHKRKKGINGTAEAIMKTWVRNRIRILPEQNIIRVDHQTDIELRTYHSRLKKRHGIVKTRRSGTIHIYIESVKDGQNMRLRLPTPSNLFKSEVREFSTNFIGKKSTIQNEAKSYTRLLKDHKDFKTAVSRIQDAIQEMDAFVIPSGGTFFLRDALFNDECDLLLKASYNGVD